MKLAVHSVSLPTKTKDAILARVRVAKRVGKLPPIVGTSSIGPLIVASELDIRRSSRNYSDAFHGNWNRPSVQWGNDHKSFTLPIRTLDYIMGNNDVIKEGVKLFNSTKPNRPATISEAKGITFFRQGYRVQDGYIWHLGSRAIWVADKPTQYHQNARNRWHNNEGPALAWKDGFELYFIDGAIVPKNLVMNPSKLEIEDILSQRNAEIVRLIVEKMGPENFVKKSKAKVIDADEVESTTVSKNDLKPIKFIDKRTLLEIPLPKLPDKMAKMVFVECPSTGHKALLGVPPRMRSVKEAVKWIERPPTRANYEMVLET